MNTIQNNYKQAEFNYNEALAKYEAIMIAYEDLLETDGNKYEDLSIEAESVSGLHTATLELRKAKDNLIQWAINTIKDNPEYISNQETLNTLFAQIKYRPSIERKVINLCMKLEQVQNIKLQISKLL